MTDSKKETEDEPKLVVDTDWKEQVAREKELAAEAEETSDQDGPTSEVTASDESASGEESGASEGQFPAAPPASFEVLISMMFTQAMAMLGQMPDPGTGETTVNKPYAKHYIDTLEMLGEKTQGNLKEDESKILSEALHALRMAYVNVKA